MPKRQVSVPKREVCVPKRQVYVPKRQQLGLRGAETATLKKVPKWGVTHKYNLPDHISRFPCTLRPLYISINFEANRC